MSHSGAIAHATTVDGPVASPTAAPGRVENWRAHLWYRTDLLLYHRQLRCLVSIDLKVGQFTHADVGQMNLYVNYAREHLTLPDENSPVGLILCSERNAAVACYALDNLLNTVMAAEYRLALPDPKQLEDELDKTRRMLQSPIRGSEHADARAMTIAFTG